MYTYTIGIDFLGWNAVKRGKVAICFKPFGFLLFWISGEVSSGFQTQSSTSPSAGDIPQLVPQQGISLNQSLSREYPSTNPSAGDIIQPVPQQEISLNQSLSRGYPPISPSAGDTPQPIPQQDGILQPVPQQGNSFNRSLSRGISPSQSLSRGTSLDCDSIKKVQYSNSSRITSNKSLQQIYSTAWEVLHYLGPYGYNQKSDVWL